MFLLGEIGVAVCGAKGVIRIEHPQQERRHIVQDGL